ncbi:MAG: alpha-N-arabinofuranosidase, partial [Acetatifactor sp.]|nr:alpha-N-arabinofuranosidase [Acetatifactor sp.]
DKGHQDAELLESAFAGEQIIGTEENKVPSLQESVSLQKDGSILATLANLSVTESYPVEILLAETKPEQVKASILTGEMHAHNTFEEPDTVKEAAFEAVTVTQRGVSFTIPPCSVVSLEIR